MASGNPQHASHHGAKHVDHGDQLSSVIILGIAVAGAVLTILAYWVLGG